MARPIKEGLDYFPLDIGIDQDDKLIVPIGKYGMQGFGIIIRLMSEIYKNSYFYQWSEKEQYVFSNKVNVDINLVNDVVNECAKWGFFCEKLLSEHQILTSRGFQRRYIDAAKRRKSITMIDKYLLVDPLKESEDLSILVNDVNGNKVNVYIKPNKSSASVAGSTQSKVKESKVESTKDISAEIFNFRSRYSSDLLKIIDSYLVFIADMRKSKKVGDGIILKVYQQFARYTSAHIEYAIKTHMGNPDYSRAKEEYTFGIMRNTSEEEATRKLSNNAIAPAGKKGATLTLNDRHFEKNRLEVIKIKEAMEREGVRNENAVLAN